ncbi:MAG: hypothetical protein FJ405_05595 [Verrucomicrobia bacterium]|nr:hypothetical protein [Verrucomicrobiota bacterium]
MTSFNELTLRASSTDGWSVEDASPWTRPKATYLRDPWMKDTQQTLGWPCGHSRYVNLFLNGLYWGQYNLAERTESTWLAENFGGEPEDYDIIKDVNELEAGSRAAWDAMIAQASAGLATDAAYYRIQGMKPDGTRDPALPNYLNVDSLIDYMVVHIYAGAIDWPNHNWWSARRRTPDSDGFRFFTWDQEISNISLTTETTYTNERFEAVSGPTHSPAFLYARLRENRLFRARFAARAIELTTGFGSLTPLQNQWRWQRRQSEIDRSIVAESARWGDSRQSTPLTRADWLAEMNWMRTTYWPQIHQIAVGRFQSVGLYSTSSLPAVSIVPPGGVVTRGTRVRLSGGGLIYYTTNGLDPVAPGGEPTNDAMLYSNTLPIQARTEIRARRVLSGAVSGLSSALFLTSLEVAPESSLAVSEIHYQPNASESEEFVEVWNRSSTQHAIVSGLRISGGLDAVFPQGLVLKPGERSVAVRDPAAFQRVHGPLRPAAAKFDGQLNNGGDWVHLLGASGASVSRFRYETSAGWSTSPKGLGPSLTLMRSTQVLDPSDPASWRASLTQSGTPGWNDGDSFEGDPFADRDSDGLNALTEYFLGTVDDDVASGRDHLPRWVRSPEGSLELRLIRARGSDQTVFHWESSEDLRQWTRDPGIGEAESWIREELEELSWKLSTTHPARRFLRLRLELR